MPGTPTPTSTQVKLCSVFENEADGATVLFLFLIIFCFRCTERVETLLYGTDQLHTPLSCFRRSLPFFSSPSIVFAHTSISICQSADTDPGFFIPQSTRQSVYPYSGAEAQQTRRLALLSHDRQIPISSLNLTNHTRSLTAQVMRQF